MHIYLVTNLVNGKMYVGQTTLTVEKRWQEHLKNARKGNPNRLYQAIRKHGPQAFVVERLTGCDDPERLNELEKMWITILDTYDYKSGYNMTKGGDGHSAPCTEETRNKMSLAAMGRKWEMSQEGKDAVSRTHKGKPKPLAQRQKMAAAWTPERRARQAKTARRVNAIENKKLRDFKCPDCGKEFKQVARGVYSGHRKGCLYWKDVSINAAAPGV